MEDPLKGTVKGTGTRTSSFFLRGTGGGTSSYLGEGTGTGTSSFLKGTLNCLALFTIEKRLGENPLKNALCGTSRF